MSTFILTWNPEKWDYEPGKRDHLVERTRAGQTIPGNWSTGSRRSGIAPGDRVYMLRQHDQRGLVASGFATTEIYDDVSWDGSGRLAHYIEIRWDKFVALTDRIPIDTLIHEVPEVAWKYLQGSGVQVELAAEHLLDELWDRWTAGFHDLQASIDPELVAAEQAIAAAISPPTGQGYAISVDRKRAVETRAMELTTEYFEHQGWNVEDVSAGRSFDLLCKRAAETRMVEVKGTSGVGESIMLTANEVDLALGDSPTALAVVAGIEVSESEDGPVASGGTLHVIDPWRPVKARLEPTAYRYRI